MNATILVISNAFGCLGVAGRMDMTFARDVAVAAAVAAVVVLC